MISLEYAGLLGIYGNRIILDYFTTFPVCLLCNTARYCPDVCAKVNVEGKVSEYAIVELQAVTRETFLYSKNSGQIHRVCS